MGYSSPSWNPKVVKSDLSCTGEGVIEMMTPFKLLDFGDEGTFYPLVVLGRPRYTLKRGIPPPWIRAVISDGAPAPFQGVCRKQPKELSFGYRNAFISRFNALCTLRVKLYHLAVSFTLQNGRTLFFFPKAYSKYDSWYWNGIHAPERKIPMWVSPKRMMSAQ